MKIKANRIHGRVHDELGRPRSARYGPARRKRLLTGSRFTAIKTVKKPRAASAGDVIPAFFESIAGAHLEVPETTSGSLKFDVKEGSGNENWRVTFNKGLVSS